MSARKLPSLRKPDPADQPGPADEASGPGRPAREEPAAGDHWPPATGFRFDLRRMFLLMLIGAIALAGWGGMRRGVDREFYVVFATAAPVAVLAVLGLLHQIAKWRR